MQTVFSIRETPALLLKLAVSALFTFDLQSAAASAPSRPAVFEVGVKPGTFVRQGSKISTKYHSGGIEFSSLASGSVSLSFEASAPTSPTGEDRLASVSNYFVGNEKDWRIGVPNFGRVR